MGLRLLCLFMAGAAFGDTLEVIRAIPHSGYSEGLDWKDGHLWHALPKEIVKIDPKDGTVLRRFKPATPYSESLIWVKGSLWNVSYHDNGIYEGTLEGSEFAFTRRGNVPEAHAWGLEYDGRHFVVTGNYNRVLYFLDPKTFAVARKVRTPVKDLEDLAWDGTGMWTSSYTEHPGTIFRVNPRTGAISRFFTLPDPSKCPVVDGIAYDGKTLWLTGKHCPSIFNVKIPSERLLSSE